MKHIGPRKRAHRLAETIAEIPEQIGQHHRLLPRKDNNSLRTRNLCGDGDVFGILQNRSGICRTATTDFLAAVSNFPKASGPIKDEVRYFNGGPARCGRDAKIEGRREKQ